MFEWKHFPYDLSEQTYSVVWISPFSSRNWKILAYLRHGIIPPNLLFKNLSLKSGSVGSKTILDIGCFLIYEKSGLGLSNVDPLVETDTAPFVLPQMSSIYTQAQLDNTILPCMVDKAPPLLHSETWKYPDQGGIPMAEKILTKHFLRS